MGVEWLTTYCKASMSHVHNYFVLIYFQTQDTITNIFVHYTYLESIYRNLS